MALVLKSGWFHKKGLGFVSPAAASLVSKEDLEQCGKRFAALVHPESAEEPWHIRLFKIQPALDSPHLTAALETVVSNPEIPLKGVFVLSSSVQIKLANGILSLCTAERTLLLVSDEVGEWYSVISAYLTERRQAESNAAANSAREASQAQNARRSVRSATVPHVINTTGAQLTTLESVLADKPLRQRFRVFVQSAFAVENLDFYEAIERHMLIPERDIPAQKASVRSIVDKYVRENSPEQVNLASNQAEALIQSLDSPEMGEMLLCLLQCQHEIQELLRRNFFFRFASMLNQERQRERLLQETQGCFPALVVNAGVDAYLAVLERFFVLQRENKYLFDHVKRRHDMVAQYVQTMLQPAAVAVRAASLDGTLPSSSSAIKSSLEMFELQSKAMADYLEEVKQAVLDPLKDMSDTIDMTLLQIVRAHQQKCDTVLATRTRAAQMGQTEIARKNSVVQLSSKLAELEAGGKKKEKELKKQLAQFEKVKQESEQAEKLRSDAELEFVMTESTINEDLNGALLQLESLALYRLDTLKDLLRRLAFAEQTVLTRLGLKFQTTLNECSNVDTIRDLVAIAKEAEKVALERRKQALHPAVVASEQMQASRNNPIEAAHLPMDDVPLAQPIASTPRRRFF